MTSNATIPGMRAAYYERIGPANEVLRVGELPTPEPGPGEVRIRVHFSGVNPSDIKTRNGLRGGALPFPRIVPHSDGAGFIDAVGAGAVGHYAVQLAKIEGASRVIASVSGPEKAALARASKPV